VTSGHDYRLGPLERFFRDARTAIVMGPSNTIAHDWIGKTLVGQPLEPFYEGGE
jgi:alkylation response protein AidB-like acyl-CoA dehydrogenase